MRGLVVFLLLFLFLVGIRGLGTGFKGLGKDLLDAFFHATGNPLLGLMVGILGTTLVQSSSVTTSMIVALVAAPENPLPIPNAIPMIMGANIGTTVTSTVVALGHVGRKDEFQRAFAAATCHDFFNFISVAILLPLELQTGILARASRWATGFVATREGAKLPNPIKDITKAAVEPLQSLLDVLASPLVAAILLIIISFGIILAALVSLVRTLRQLAGTRVQGVITRALDANAYVGMLVGVIVTVMVQSSSITTSITVPLAGAGIVTLAQVFPITVGANIGTTLTALVASMAAPDETAHLAIQIALVHLLFNFLGTVIIYPLAFTRRVPLMLATGLAKVAVRSQKIAVIVVVLFFYGFPAALIAIWELF